MRRLVAGSAKRAEVFPFLKLPRELRDAIYDYYGFRPVVNFHVNSSRHMLASAEDEFDCMSDEPDGGDTEDAWAVYKGKKKNLDLDKDDPYNQPYFVHPRLTYAAPALSLVNRQVNVEVQARIRHIIKGSKVQRDSRKIKAVPKGSMVQRDSRKIKAVPKGSMVKHDSRKIKAVLEASITNYKIHGHPSDQFLQLCSQGRFLLGGGAETALSFLGRLSGRVDASIRLVVMPSAYLCSDYLTMRKAWLKVDTSGAPTTWIISTSTIPLRSVRFGIYLSLLRGESTEDAET